MSKDVAAGLGQEPGKGGGRGPGEGKGRTFNPRLRFNSQYSSNNSFEVRRRGGAASGGSQAVKGQSLAAAVASPGTPTPRGNISALSLSGGGTAGSASPGGKKFNPRATFNPKTSVLSAHPATAAAVAAATGVPIQESGLAVYADHAANSIPGAPYGGMPRDFRAALDRNAGQQTVLMPLQHHLYAPSPYRVRPSLLPYERLAEDLFIPESLRQELLQRNEAILRVLPGESMLPKGVGVYHTLVPLDMKIGSEEMLGYRKWNYKAVSTLNGRTYCLTRVADFELTQERAMSYVQRWLALRRCASLVGVVEAFTTMAFGDHSLVVVYEFYPNAQLLSSVYNNPPVSEQVAWSLAAQMVNGITTVHAANLAVRTLSCDSVLVTSKNRVRLGYGALRDVLSYEQAVCNNNANSPVTVGNSAASPGGAVPTNTGTANSLPSSSSFNSGTSAGSAISSETTIGPEPDITELQKQDWHCLAAILRKLCSGGNTGGASRNNQESEEDGNTNDDPLIVSGSARGYAPISASTSFTEFVAELSSDNPSREKIVAAMAPHFLSTFNNTLAKSDAIEETLSHELENGRLVRLLCKLEFVIDRPCQINDPAWLPKGELYPLRLLRHYIFHQRDESGYPTADLAHVLVTLNKLDVGIDENLLLISPDGKTRIVMSYAELKKLVSKQFAALVAHRVA